MIEEDVDLADFFETYKLYAEEYAARSYNTILESMEGAFEQNEEILQKY